MEKTWKSGLSVDPVAVLAQSKDPALLYFIQRDLLGESVGSVETLWELPKPGKLISKQLPNGAWPYPGKANDVLTNAKYNLLETYRSLRILVEMYGMNREHPTLRKAVEYVFSCQTKQGDIRGIAGNQYMPYYHAALLELLIKAGYQDDNRMETGLQWLLSKRQADGGWMIPAQLIPSDRRKGNFWQGTAVEPDPSAPHSHLATGMVLRAFAAHPAYRNNKDILKAAERLSERFFKPDKYTDRKATSYWVKFQFPFWWTNLLTGLDSLSMLGFGRQNAQVAQALGWFIQNQSQDGLWETGYGFGREAGSTRNWVGLAICRVIKRVF